MSAGRWEELLPGLSRWKCGLHGPHQPVNSFVVQNGDEVALIDPSADLDAKALLDIGIRHVGDILITHFQEENVVGCLHFPEARIHVPSGDEYLAAGTGAYESDEIRWPPPWDWTERGNERGSLAGARNERPLASALHLDTVLTPGSIIAGFEVLSSPGHGKHAVTLVTQISGMRIGFCGDLVYDGGRLWNWFDCDWDYGYEKGQRMLFESAGRLSKERLALLCPAHGEVIRDVASSLDKLRERLAAVLLNAARPVADSINFPERDSVAPGFREILPGLHQWRKGNCAILVSRTGGALMVDDGLCCWKPIPDRESHHWAVIDEAKRVLGIHKIEIAVPTHYHGDHTENIPSLVEREGTEVVCLDLVANPMERPRDFNLACSLPWYGTKHGSLRVHRRLPGGSRFRWHEFEFEIFHLGGQTYYALGLEVTIHGTRTLFIGDAIDPCPLPEPVLCYNKAEPETAGWQYALDRMIERRPDLLVGGHGIALRDPMAFLRRKRAAWVAHIERFRVLSARSDLKEFFDPFLRKI